jgi:hypothetical protein
VSTCLVEWVCPLQHRIFAMGWEDTVYTLEQMEAVGEKLFAHGLLPRCCGICGSPDHHVEQQELPFETLREALPWIKEDQAEATAYRRHLEMLGYVHGPWPVLN